MPFYVDYSTKRRTIAIQDVSPVQFIICEAFGYIITLEAVLNDYVNHRNVTLEWKQIKGTLAILSHPNETVTTFTYTDTSDKIFRFYIDRGTARETYIDARVYHTPLSFSKHGALVNNGLELIRIIGRTDTPKVGYSRTIVTNVLGDPAVEFDIEYIIETDLLVLADKLELFHSTNPSVYPGTLIETWTENYPDKYVAVPGYYTWVLTVTHTSGIVKTYTSETHVSSPATAVAAVGTRVIDDLVVHSGFVKTNSIGYFTFIQKSVVMDAGIGKNLGLVKTNSIVVYENTTVSASSEVTNPLIMGYNVKTIDVTKLNPSGIGSPT